MSEALGLVMLDRAALDSGMVRLYNAANSHFCLAVHACSAQQCIHVNNSLKKKKSQIMYGLLRSLLKVSSAAGYNFLV